MMPVRSDDRSNMSNIGWFSSAMNIVGTPLKQVMRSWLMEQRYADQQPVGRREVHAVADRLPVVQYVVARQHDPFREAGRTGSVLHVDFVVAADLRFRFAEHRVVGERPEGHQFGGVVHAPLLFLPDIYHVA